MVSPIKRLVDLRLHTIQLVKLNASAITQAKKEGDEGKEMMYSINVIEIGREIKRIEGAIIEHWQFDEHMQDKDKTYRRSHLKLVH